MALTPIPDTDIDADSPITVALMTALRNNGYSGSLIAFTKLTASGTHNCNAYTRYTVALLVGGGGAGAGVSTSYYSTCSGMSSTQEWSGAARSGSDALTIGIGAGGTGVSAASGNTGGSTTLTGHTTAVGGLGGLYSPGAAGSFHGQAGIGRGGAAVASGAGSAAPANSGGGGSHAVFDGLSNYAGGAGGSGVIYIWEFG